jgi:hypothetical protein
MSEEEEMNGQLLLLLSTCFAIIHRGKAESKVKTKRYTAKKVSDFPVSSQDVTNQTPPGKLLLLLSTCFAIIHHGKIVSKGKNEEEIHCKIFLAIFPSLDRMSLTKLSLPAKI